MLDVRSRGQGRNDLDAPKAPVLRSLRTPIVSVFLMRRVRPIPLVLLALYISLLAVLPGCVMAPPVQEMSDARQALRAAEDVGAATRGLASYRQAEALLERAEAQLQEGAYGRARDRAREARALAIRARDEALGLTAP